MKGAMVENSAIAINTLKTSNVPISGTSQNFLRSLANPHRSFNKSNIVRLTPVSVVAMTSIAGTLSDLSATAEYATRTKRIQNGVSISCGGCGPGFESR